MFRSACTAGGKKYRDELCRPAHASAHQTGAARPSERRTGASSASGSGLLLMLTRIPIKTKLVPSCLDAGCYAVRDCCLHFSYFVFVT